MIVEYTKKSLRSFFLYKLSCFQVKEKYRTFVPYIAHP